MNVKHLLLWDLVVISPEIQSPKMQNAFNFEMSTQHHSQNNIPNRILNSGLRFIIVRVSSPSPSPKSVPKFPPSNIQEIVMVL